MAIQMRRGDYNKFVPSKLLPAEWAVVQQNDPNAESGESIYIAFESGNVKRMATYEDMVENAVNAVAESEKEIIAELRAGAVTDATATVDGTTGTPAVSSSVEDGTLLLAFSGLKGPKGDTGATPNVSAAATVSSTTGTPSVSVTKSGTSAAPKFSFSFSGIKGEKGDTGPIGPKGDTGQSGASAWGDVADKPFDTIGTGLVVSDGVLSANVGTSVNIISPTSTDEKAPTSEDAASIAFGIGAIASGESSVAIGHVAEAAGEGSVAIGAGSVASDDWTVSVALVGNERRLVNVADPENDTDAATKAYTDNLVADVWQAVYPVGSIYMSYESTSPAQLFGGTWTQLTGVFPRFANDTATGGADSHTHTYGLRYAQARAHLTTFGNSTESTIQLYNNGSWYQTTNTGSTTASRFGGTYEASWKDMTSAIYGATVSTGSESTMPAYQDVYAWRRTA